MTKRSCVETVDSLPIGRKEEQKCLILTKRSMKRQKRKGCENTEHGKLQDLNAGMMNRLV